MILVPLFSDAGPWLGKGVMQEGRMPDHCFRVCFIHAALGFQISLPGFRQRDLVRNVLGITPSWSLF